MLIHKDILDKMTAFEKISLICDGATQLVSEDRSDGASVRIVGIRSGAKDGYVYPSDFALANTFNSELIAKVNAELAYRAKKNGAAVVRIDPAKPKTSPYSDGECEDGYMETVYLREKIRGIEKVGAKSLLGGYSMDTVDADFGDIKPDKRTLKEFYLRALDEAINEEGVAIVETSRYKKLFGEYEDINSEIVLNGLLAKRSGKIERALGLDRDRTRECYDNCALFGGDGARDYIESAYSRYETLKREAKEGIGSYDDVDIAVKKGVAVSDEILDEWADKALDLALRCKDLPADPSCFGDEEKLCRDATLESFVLLKNNDALPLSKTDKVAVIGVYSTGKRSGSFFEYALNERENDDRNFTPIAFSAGYDLIDQRTPDLIKEAVEATAEANKVIVFLGLNDERETDIKNKRVTTLPAAQSALIDALSKQKKKIVAIVSGDHSVDMSFDQCCSAVVIAPKDCSMRTSCLYDLLSGKENFSGKLANTYYDGTDEFFSEIRNDKALGRNLVGPFYNYKYYTSAKIKVRYPFGYGLSYSDFSYSGFKVIDKKVQFSVKNTSKVAGYAVYEIYSGLPSSSVIRADEELVLFGKVFLKAGESKKITAELDEKAFRIYAPNSDKWLTETGKYRLSLCDSCQSVKATATLALGGTEIKNTEVKRENYLRTVSNIVSGNYKLKPRKNYLNKKADVLFKVLTSLFASAFAVFTVLWYAGFGFLPFSIAAAAFTTLFAILIKVNKNSSKNKVKQEKEKMGKIINKQPPEETLQGKPLQELFIREFTEPETEKKQEVAVTVAKKTAEDLSGYFIKDLTLKDVSDSFVKFCLERGFVVDDSVVRTVLSSLLSSRLIVLANDDARLTSDFASLLAQYFGARAFFDDAEGKTCAADLMFDASGDEKPFGLAVDAAAQQKHNLNFAVLKDVDFACIEDVFSRFMRYVVNPSGENKLSVRNARGEEREYSLYDNLWFIMTCSTTASFKAPKFLLEAASVINLKLAVNYGEKEKLDYPTVSVHQFLSFGDAAVDKIEISEGLWKRIDKLEEFVKTRTGYSIGNKLWQRIERFMAAYIACGGETEEAEDALVAAKLLITVIKELDGVENAFENGEDVMHLIESIFGEDNVSACQNVVKCSKYAKLENKDQGENL